MTAVVLLAAAVVAAQAAAPSPATQPKPQSKPTDLICHSELDPGSRFTHKVCLTRAQLNDRREAVRQSLEDAHQQGQFAPMQPIMMGPAH